MCLIPLIATNYLSTSSCTGVQQTAILLRLYTLFNSHFTHFYHNRLSLYKQVRVYEVRDISNYPYGVFFILCAWQ